MSLFGTLLCNGGGGGGEGGGGLPVVGVGHLMGSPLLYIRERDSVLYLGMAKEISNLP